MEMSQEPNEVTQISTRKYVTSGKIEVDGMIWSVSLPGAGTEMRVSKAQRRIDYLEKKIKSDNYDESDLDKYDELEDFMFKFFKGIFKDGTEDNSEVIEWLERTPWGVIIQAFEDIKEQAKDVTSD